MPPHIHRRGLIWYLVDGESRQSLKTAKKGAAEFFLDQYIKGKYGMAPTPTIGEFFEKWIDTKVEPLYRRSTIRDYRSHFSAYILPVLRNVHLAALSTEQVDNLRLSLIKRGLSIKTVRNVIDSSFRALYRDARVKFEPLRGRDPFTDIQWPRLPRTRPDPFTAEERDKITSWYLENDCFYYPLVTWQFHTGMRPSETFALIWADIDLEQGTVSISRSRNMGTEAATKTANSERIIPIDETLVSLIKLLPSADLGLDHVFVGKRGEPMSKKWAEHFWADSIKSAGVQRHRKFYATRHTFITEMVKAGRNLKAIADYVGTSVAMIEADYCARQGLNLDRSILAHQPAKSLENMVAGPGFEPGTSRL